MTRRAFDWVLIVVLAGTWAVLFVRGIGDGLRTGRGQLRVNVSSAPSRDNYPTVIRSRSAPTLMPGDELVAVAGEDLRGSSALRFYDLATPAARERGVATVRANHEETSFDVRTELSPAAWWWMSLATALVTVLMAALLLVRAPGWHLSHRRGPRSAPHRRAF